MDNKKIHDFRNMLFCSQIRISNMALELHKEQERISDLIRILDTFLIKE